MKKVRILQTCSGSPDGCKIYRYEQGQSYDIPDQLADLLIKSKRAALEGSSSKKKEQSAPENKAAEPKENKDKKKSKKSKKSKK